VLALLVQFDDPLDGQVRRRRRVDAARQPEHRPLGAGVVDRPGDELDDALPAGLQFRLREQQVDVRPVQ